MPEIYVFGGAMRSIWPFSERHWSRMRPHGFGKTTFATTLLSTLPGVDFVNAEREALASLVVEDDDLRIRAALQQI